MFSYFTYIFLSFGLFSCKNNDSHPVPDIARIDTVQVQKALYKTDIIPGAEQTEAWLPLVANKNISLVVNQTSVVGNRHLVDTLLRLGMKINNIFAPEHGFRGTEDAGATILNSKDTLTGLQVISLYGDHKKPLWNDLADAEIVVFDIQDVGARFYTYISTLHYVMEACAENKKPLLILDRPNPNGYYVDGPVLKKEYASFVGMHPVPVVHGMTIGEYAQMINGEGWLANGVKCELKVITCKNYSHKDYCEVKIAPSPNLRTMRSIYLYPSLCFFEGTNVSVGRGTNSPFEIVGSPLVTTSDFTFTPISSPGSKTPPFQNQVCRGFSLKEKDINQIRTEHLNPGYLELMYRTINDQSKFFLPNNFFNKLAGSEELMAQIKGGLTSEEIKLSWQDDLAEFKLIRKKYLLYEDFE